MTACTGFGFVRFPSATPRFHAIATTAFATRPESARNAR